MSSRADRSTSSSVGSTRAAKREARQEAARLAAKRASRRRMARLGLIASGAVAALVAIVLAIVVTSNRPSEHLSPGAFATYAASATVLDVRTPGEFSSGHLAGAKNVDVEAADFTTRIATLDHNATYAIYCHSGNRSATALTLMKQAGFTHVKDLAGGINAWTADGRPITTG